MRIVVFYPLAEIAGFFNTKGDISALTFAVGTLLGNKDIQS